MFKSRQNITSRKLLGIWTVGAVCNRDQSSESRGIAQSRLKSAPTWHDWGLAAVLAFGIKYYYSVAGADELQWLLYPLVTLLELLSPLSFEPLTGGEWLDAQQHIRIVKACAGGNFFLISLLGYLWLLSEWRQPLSRIAAALLAAWLTTLCANSLRILLSIYAGAALSDALCLSAADSHRLIGIVSYLASICLQLNFDRRRNGYASTVIAALLYLTVTLLIPLLRGWVDDRNTLTFVYSIWVSGIPLGLLVLAYSAKSYGSKSIVAILGFGRS